VHSDTAAGVRALPATARPVQKATVAAQVPGTVARHDAALGRRVGAGDLLLTLDSPTLAAAVGHAQATLDLATAEHAREARLLDQGASTPELVRRLDDQRRIAGAALAQAEAQLAYTRVTAPFSGVVTARHVESGDTVAPDRPLLVLEGADALRAEVAVPASWPTWPTGTAIEVQAEHTSVRVRGTLAEFSPAADPATRTRLAKIDLPAHPALASGAFLRVLWPGPADTRLLVPESALLPFGQLTRVFVVREDRARLRPGRSRTARGRTPRDLCRPRRR
jgi:RND family efflux transporter MFP subunit